MNHTASVATLLSPIMAPKLHAAPHTHLLLNGAPPWRALGPTRRRSVPAREGTAIELGDLSKEFAVLSPSPALEERAGERRPFNAASANSMVVPPEGEIVSAASQNFNFISNTLNHPIQRMPEPIKCLPAILLSFLAGALGMSAFFGILLPMLLSVPAIGSQLGTSAADAACQLHYSRSDFAPVTNAVSTATGIILKREDF